MERVDVHHFDIPGLTLIVPKRFSDTRGHFSETWSDRLFREKIENVPFVQDNQSMSAKKATVRGLHFQKPPFAQAKLVQVVRGFDSGRRGGYPERLSNLWAACRGEARRIRRDAAMGSPGLPARFLHARRRDRSIL